MKKTRTMVVNREGLKARRVANLKRGEGENRLQRILVGYAVVGTGMGWGLYLARSPGAFFFMATVPMALIAAMGIEYLRTR